MSSKRIIKFIALVLVCILCSLIGGLAALRFMPSKVIGESVVIDALSDDVLLNLFNRSMNKISEEISPSIVSVISKGSIGSETPDNDKDDEEKDNDKDKDEDKDKDDINLGTGSGIIISQDGYILTNYHVVQVADSIVVRLSNGKEYPAELVGKDSRSDIAVLKIEEDNLVAAKLGDSSKLKSGDLAFAIGNPLGLELTGSITMGIISGTDRTLMVDGQRLTLIQTDTAINPGNSGGALVNINGEVIGINTLKEFYAGSISGIPVGVEGVGFAIPINVAKPIVEELIDKGYIRRPGLGVTIIINAVPKDKDAPMGLIVETVSEDGPADKAGIKSGDIIIKFQGEKVSTFQELVDKINEHRIGDQVVVTVWREGEEKDFTVRLEQLQD